MQKGWLLFRVVYLLFVIFLPQTGFKLEAGSIARLSASLGVCIWKGKNMIEVQTEHATPILHALLMIQLQKPLNT